MEVLLLLFVFFLIVFLIKLSLRPTNFPPGPRGLPLLGYSPLMPKNEPVHKTFRNLAKVYGPITGFFLGPVQPFISVDGPKAVREALQNEDLNGRPTSAIMSARTYGEKLGILLTDGEFWQEQRRFTLRHLRDLGFGKTSIEDQMMDEVSDLISDISSASESDPNHVVNFSSIFTISISNILWAIIGGKRYQRDDQALKDLLDSVLRFSRSSNTVQATIPIPAFLINLFPSLPKMIGVDMELFSPMRKFAEEAVEEHIATRSKGDGVHDFLDVYLNEMEKHADKNTSPTTFNKNQLVAIVMDLFGAGSETSSNTIGFAILYAIHFPVIQKKLQDELDDICGESTPSLTHRSRLPYTEAFLMEVMRFITVAPLALPHCAIRDTQLQGFTIPKGSILTVNLDSLFNDPAAWNDPENFRPERHLDEQGNIVKNDAFIPFGLGKRVCLGEPLARNTIFLFVTALMKKFEFKPIPDEPLPTLEPTFGFTQGPKSFKAIVVPRKL